VPELVVVVEVLVAKRQAEQPLAETAATVSVITAADIARSLSGDLRDLVRLEPGVAVGADGCVYVVDGGNDRVI